MLYTPSSTVSAGPTTKVPDADAADGVSNGLEGGSILTRKRKEARSLQNQVRRLQTKLNDVVDILLLLKDETWLEGRGLIEANHNRPGSMDPEQ